MRRIRWRTWGRRAFVVLAVLAMSSVLVAAAVVTIVTIQGRAADQVSREQVAQILREDRTSRAVQAADVEAELAERARGLQLALDEVERRNAAQIAAADQRDQERYEALFAAIGAIPPEGTPPTPLVTPPPVVPPRPSGRQAAPAPGPPPGGPTSGTRSASPPPPPTPAPAPPPTAAPRPGNPPSQSNRPSASPGQERRQRAVEVRMDLPILEVALDVLPVPTSKEP